MTRLSLELAASEERRLTLAGMREEQALRATYQVNTFTFGSQSKNLIIRCI